MKRHTVFVIVRKDDDMFVAVAKTREGAEQFIGNGAGKRLWKVLEMETVEGTVTGFKGFASVAEEEDDDPFGENAEHYGCGVDDDE